MFAVITVERENKKSAILKRRKCRVEANNIAVKGGAPFRHIKIYPGKKGIDWKSVERAAGCAVKSVITQNGVKLPQNTYLNEFVSDTLPLILMINTAAKNLDKGESAKKRTLIVFDKKGALPQYIERIVLCAYKIKIVTDYPEKYYSVCSHLLENYGASPVVCSSLNEKEKFDVCIAEKEGSFAKLNYSADKIGTQGFGVKTSEEYIKLCPQGVDEFLFLCAMFECGGVSAIGNLSLE